VVASVTLEPFSCAVESQHGFDDMELKTWKPLADLASIRERVSQLTQTSNVWAPAADWYETDDDLILVLDAPGCDPDSFEIAHDNESLTVAGTREAQEFGEARRRERPEGTFQRSLEVPESVEPGSAVAQYRAGQLEVRFRKLGRTITVEPG
jgi:HSP20 family protein